MSYMNKVIIIGNLGRDPEVRFTPGGSAVCNISVATTRSWIKKGTDERVSETEWHRVVLYDRLAEIAGEYLKKGKPVCIEGRLKTRKWADQAGVERYTTEIVAEKMSLLGASDSRAGEGGAAPAAQGPESARSAAPSGAANVPRQPGGGYSTAVPRSSPAAPPSAMSVVRSHNARPAAERVPSPSAPDWSNEVPF